MTELSKYTPRTLWDPFSSLGEIHEEFDRLFDNLKVPHVYVRETYSPAVDIVEEDEKYMVKAEIPGIDQKDVKITLNDNVLTIQGARKNEYEDKKEGVRRIERSYGSFSRSFYLENEVLADKVKAGYKDGILTIELPKSKKELKEIEIKVN